MKRIFKVLQGQHKGAELALPEGAVFKAGHASTCDLVLLDATLADEAFELACSASAVQLTAITDGILVGDHLVAKGERCVVPLYTEVAVGMTRFCLGEADRPWPKIRPCRSPERKRRSGCGWLCFGIVLLGGAWAFWMWWQRTLAAVEVTPLPMEAQVTPEALAERLGLQVERWGTQLRVVGNVTTVAERNRLRHLFRSQAPEVLVELTDDETLLRSVEALLATLNEAKLRVAQATNRCVALEGTLSSPTAWPRIEEAIRMDVPYICQLTPPPVVPVLEEMERPAVDSATEAAPVAHPVKPDLPIAAILQTPFPCLILKNGMRCAEGGVLLGYTILRIEGQRVTVQKEGAITVWTP